MSTLRIRLPDSLHERLKEATRKEGMSMNQLITLTVSEKLSVLMTWIICMSGLLKATGMHFV